MFPVICNGINTLLGNFVVTVRKVEDTLEILNYPWEIWVSSGAHDVIYLNFQFVVQIFNDIGTNFLQEVWYSVKNSFNVNGVFHSRSNFQNWFLG